MFSVPRDARRWVMESGDGLRQHDKVEEKGEKKGEKVEVGVVGNNRPTPST